MYTCTMSLSLRPVLVLIMCYVYSLIVWSEPLEKIQGCVGWNSQHRAPRLCDSSWPRRIFTGTMSGFCSKSLKQNFSIQLLKCFQCGIPSNPHNSPLGIVIHKFFSRSLFLLLSTLSFNLSLYSKLHVPFTLKNIFLSQFFIECQKQNKNHKYIHRLEQQ